MAQNQNTEYKKLKNLIKTDKFEIISNCLAYDVCILSNNNILATTYNSICILNEKFEVLRKKELYHGYAKGCVLSPQKNKIYISNHHDGCIDLYDYELNKELGKSVGSEGSGKNQFYGIGRMTWYESNLYVCDELNKRIQVLRFNDTEESLEFVDEIKLDDIPYTIKISNDMIGLSCNSGSYFYELRTKKLKFEFETFYGSMNLINSIFVVTQSSLMKETPRDEILLIDLKSNQGPIIAGIIKISKKLKDYISRENLTKYHFINYNSKILVYSQITW
jgi:hypothetical protein